MKNFKRSRKKICGVIFVFSCFFFLIIFAWFMYFFVFFKIIFAWCLYILFFFSKFILRDFCILEEAACHFLILFVRKFLIFLSHISRITFFIFLHFFNFLHILPTWPKFCSVWNFCKNNFWQIFIIFLNTPSNLILIYKLDLILLYQVRSFRIKLELRKDNKVNIMNIILEFEPSTHLSSLNNLKSEIWGELLTK